MKRILVLAFCLLFSVALAQAARVDGCACGIPSQVPTPWAIRHVDPIAQQAAMEAFTMWNQYVDVLRPVLQTGNFTFGNGVSEIYFVDLSDVLGMDGASFLGYTPSLPDTAFGNFNECPVPAGTPCGGAITEADVMMNNTFPWQMTRPGLGQAAAYYQATATHELGHGMGFHHNWANYSEMNYLPHFARFVSRTDVLAARKQFPAQTRPVIDLATYPFTYNENGQTGGDDASNAIATASVSPSSVAPGGTITIKNWTVENLSNSAVANVRLRFYLSTDTNITTSDTFFAYFYWDPSLNTWSDDPVGFQFKIPTNLPNGQYYLGAIVGTGDDPNFHADNFTYNNSWFIPTPISVGSGNSGPTICTPSDSTLCLANKRFSVSVTWNNGGNQGGAGHTLTLTDASGLFWFSSPDNIEMLVKVLDGACGINNRIWVFGAAATSLAYDITVLDNHTGKTKVYHNDNNHAANAIIDTGAFATCGQ
ncbi:MAG TPA: hypothetical protein VLV78_16410 [Thermoanaerobaculia bacterium]|nr:hypothetical protein [Thermoanaerobaculia bacterium]